MTDVTQQGAGNTQTYLTPSILVTAANYRAGKRYTMRISGHGFYQVSADAGTTWSYVRAYTTAGGAAISGAVQGRVSQVMIQRNAALENITAANDALPKTLYSFKKISYEGWLRGFLQASETPLDNDPNTTPSTLTLPFGTDGSIAGAAIFENMEEVIRFNEGGANALTTRFRFTGPTTLVTNPFDLLRFDTTIALDNGQTLTGSFTPEMLRADVNYDEAGIIPFQYNGILSDFAFA